MSRIPIGVFAAVATIAAVPSAQPRDQFAWEAFTVTAPSGAEVQAERGWLQVPERHARPEGPKVRLPVVRFRATGPNAGPPLVWLEGGPGGAGVRRATVGSYPLFEALRPYGDVIAFDQRGTGAAEPSLAVSGRLDIPATESVASPAAQRRLAAVAETIRNEIRGRGIDLAGYNTDESAQDVEVLRQALGVEKIVIVAHSYGTHLGLAVIKRYGMHVERAILGGVNGLDQRWREPAESDRWLERVADSIGRDPAIASLAPDFVAQVRRVFARLEREPMTVQLNGRNVLIGKSEIQLLVTLQSGDIGFVQNMPALFAALDKGTGMEPVATAVQQAIRERPIGTAMTYAMHVASGVSPDLQRRIAAQAPTSIFANAINWGIGDDGFVKALGVSDLGEEFRVPFRSDVPVLLISAMLDGRTTEADARAVGRQFSRATYVTLDGASHDFFFRRESWTAIVPTIGGFLRRETITDQRLAVPIRFSRPQ